MSEMIVAAINKTLSANDTGQTGGHQAGILVPKAPGILSFFPSLGKDSKNPRVKLNFIDDFGDTWCFNFIYYNNRFHGGTRDEYRLTGMTSFIKQNNLNTGDTITFEKYSNSTHRITYSRRESDTKQAADDILRLGSTWKVVKL